MTSPAPTRRLTLAAAATLTATLAVTACTSDGGDATHTPTGKPTTATPTPSATQAPTPPATGLDGNWLTTANGKAVVLVITHTRAALFTTGGTVCSGTAESPTIRLKCGTHAAGARTTGRIDAVNKTTLKVTWQGDLGTETYTRSEDGKAPTFLPTAGLGS